MQATEAVRDEIDIKLHPKHLADAKGGLQKIVSEQLMTYSAKLKGVPVKAIRITLLEKNGLVYEDMPAVHVRAAVDLLVFKPEVGEFLEAVINKVTPSHIGLLVNQHFSASIPKDNLPEEYEHRPSQDEFVYQDSTERSLSPGTCVQFKIQALETSSHGVIHILGDLRPAGTG